MRIVCRHGFFEFYSETEGDVARYASKFKFQLVKGSGAFHTFPTLSALPTYSIKGAKFGNFTALVNYEGQQSDVMRANGIVYEPASDLLIAKTSVTVRNDPKQQAYHYLSPSPFLQPGALTRSGLRILSYDGFFVDGVWELRLNGVAYE